MPEAKLGEMWHEMWETRTPILFKIFFIILGFALAALVIAFILIGFAQSVSIPKVNSISIPP